MATCASCGRKLVRAGRNEEITGDGGAIFQWVEYDVCPVCRYPDMDVQNGHLRWVHGRYRKDREEALRRMTPEEIERLVANAARKE